MFSQDNELRAYNHAKACKAMLGQKGALRQMLKLHDYIDSCPSRLDEIKLKPSNVLRSPIMNMTHVAMCLSDPNTCTTFPTTNKPLGRRPTSLVHGVNDFKDLNLKLYMHLLDTHACIFWVGSSQLPAWRAHVTESLIHRCIFSTTIYKQEQNKMKNSSRLKDWHLHFINLTAALILGILIGVQQQNLQNPSKSPELQ